MADLREIEKSSIRAFVQSAADEGYLSGRVLDYGCGKQPYRDIVEAAGGEYVGYDRADYPANVSGEDVGPRSDEWGYPYEGYDAILCTQVVQYLPVAKNPGYSEHLPFIFGEWSVALNDGRFNRNTGWLVLTYPTNWPEVEPEDLHRFTKAGMERLLTEAGFEIVRHEMRYWIRGATGPWETDILSDKFALGYGVIARA